MPTISIPHIWYFPSTYGDIRLEQVDKRHTKVIYFKLSHAEAKAMTTLREASTSLHRRWATKDEWTKVQPRDFGTGEAEERAITLSASIGTLGQFLRKQLKADKETITVVRTGQGEITEVRDFVKDDGNITSIEEARGDDPYRKEGEEDDEPLAATGTDDATPTKAVTVEKPTLGCPAPSFEQIRLRATRVLRAFLTPQQAADFERHQRFVSTGKDTGHHYMLTSRNAPDELAMHGSRSLFDLDENRSYCVHNWDVPAEEELLSLHCLLSVPGYETWARALPSLGDDTDGLGAIDTLLAGV